MNRLYLLILFAASCHSNEDGCQDIDKPPNPTSDCCGLQLASDDLEISGDAAINQFPWLALIENKKGRLTCTGTLISSIHVLTAAQCTFHEPIKVRLGEFNKTHSGPDCLLVKGKQICNDGAIAIDIASVKSHPEFKQPNHLGHDIAIIKLADKVPYSEFIRPICLPTSDVLVSPPDNLRFINAGWGSRPSINYEDDVVKHYVTLPYVNLKKCQEIHRLRGNTRYEIGDSHVCAGGEKDLDSCRGDGGGPLMFKENGHYTLIDKCAVLGGDCVSIMECDELLERIKKSSEDRDDVLKYTCGFDEMVPRVCCPERKPTPCITPEGSIGSCVSIEMCPDLWERIKSAREDDMEYVQQAGCEGPEPNSVCCDPMLDIIPKTPNRYKNKACSSVNKAGLISVDQVSNNNSCCGKPASNRIKIIGGEKTSIDEYPWLAMLEYERPHLCGGSLISSLYVLTAAHCLVDGGMELIGVKAVRLGEYNTTNEGKDCVEVAGDGEDCTDGAITITINNSIVHPDYKRVENVQNANDIGLLRLSKSAPYTDFIRPICLPSSDITKMAISSKLTFQAAGWGQVLDNKLSSDVKLDVNLPFLEQKVCEKQFSMYGKSILWDKQLCAGGELNIDTCKGDSGGPLTYSHDNKKHQIVGIISFGTAKCGLEGRSGVFTKVIEYVPWILANTKI